MLTKYERPLADLRRKVYQADASEVLPGMKSAYDQLKPAERIFVSAYISNDDPRKSAMLAYPGISESVAKVRAFDLLSRPLVQAAVNEKFRKITERFEITAENVTREIALMAFARMGDYIRITSEGEPFIDLSELTSEQMAAIAEVTVEDYVEGRGEDARDVRKVKFKLHDKGGALDKLAKIVGAYAPERLELTGANGGPVETRSVTVTMTPEQAALEYQKSLEDGQ